MLRRFQRPRFSLLATELPRAVADGVRLLAALGRLRRHMPRGDGHSVLVLPGFLVGDGSTYAIRHLLRERNYDVHGWELDRNMGLRPGVAEAMSARLLALVDRSGRKVSLIGHSLGGIYAHKLAYEMPACVRQVITLAGPCGVYPASTRAMKLYQYSTKVSRERLEEEADRFRAPTDIPASAVYTKGDGIVPWQGAMLPPGHRRESIRVRSSHIGLAVHPGVMAVLADRLAQTEGTWTPFRCSPWNKAYFAND